MQKGKLQPQELEECLLSGPSVLPTPESGANYTGEINSQDSKVSQPVSVLNNATCNEAVQEGEDEAAPESLSSLHSSDFLFWAQQMRKERELQKTIANTETKPKSSVSSPKQTIQRTGQGREQRAISPCADNVEVFREDDKVEVHREDDVTCNDITCSLPIVDEQCIDYRAEIRPAAMDDDFVRNESESCSLPIVDEQFIDYRAEIRPAAMEDDFVMDESKSCSLPIVDEQFIDYRAEVRPAAMDDDFVRNESESCSLPIVDEQFIDNRAEIRQPAMEDDFVRDESKPCSLPIVDEQFIDYRAEIRPAAMEDDFVRNESESCSLPIAEEQVIDYIAEIRQAAMEDDFVRDDSTTSNSKVRSCLPIDKASTGEVDAKISAQLVIDNTNTSSEKDIRTESSISLIYPGRPAAGMEDNFFRNESKSCSFPTVDEKFIDYRAEIRPAAMEDDFVMDESTSSNNKVKSCPPSDKGSTSEVDVKISAKPVTDNAGSSTSESSIDSVSKSITDKISASAKSDKSAATESCINSVAKSVTDKISARAKSEKSAAIASVMRRGTTPTDSTVNSAPGHRDGSTPESRNSSNRSVTENTGVFAAADTSMANALILSVVSDSCSNPGANISNRHSVIHKSCGTTSVRERGNSTSVKSYGFIPCIESYTDSDTDRSCGTTSVRERSNSKRVKSYGFIPGTEKKKKIPGTERCTGSETDRSWPVTNIVPGERANGAEVNVSENAANYQSYGKVCLSPCVTKYPVSREKATTLRLGVKPREFLGPLVSVHSPIDIKRLADLDDSHYDDTAYFEASLDNSSLNLPYRPVSWEGPLVSTRNSMDIKGLTDFDNTTYSEPSLDMSSTNHSYTKSNPKVYKHDVNYSNPSIDLTRFKKLSRSERPLQNSTFANDVIEAIYDIANVDHISKYDVSEENTCWANLSGSRESLSSIDYADPMELFYMKLHLSHGLIVDESKTRRGLSPDQDDQVTDQPTTPTCKVETSQHTDLERHHDTYCPKDKVNKSAPVEVTYISTQLPKDNVDEARNRDIPQANKTQRSSAEKVDTKSVPVTKSLRWKNIDKGPSRNTKESLMYDKIETSKVIASKQYDRLQSRMSETASRSNQLNMTFLAHLEGRKAPNNILEDVASMNDRSEDINSVHREQSPNTHSIQPENMKDTEDTGKQRRNRKHKGNTSSRLPASQLTDTRPEPGTITPSLQKGGYQNCSELGMIETLPDVKPAIKEKVENLLDVSEKQSSILSNTGTIRKTRTTQKQRLSHNKTRPSVQSELPCSEFELLSKVETQKADEESCDIQAMEKMLTNAYKAIGDMKAQLANPAPNKVYLDYIQEVSEEHSTYSAYESEFTETNTSSQDFETDTTDSSSTHYVPSLQTSKRRHRNKCDGRRTDVYKTRSTTDTGIHRRASSRNMSQLPSTPSEMPYQFSSPAHATSPSAYSIDFGEVPTASDSFKTLDSECYSSNNMPISTDIQISSCEMFGSERAMQPSRVHTQAQNMHKHCDNYNAVEDIATPTKKSGKTHPRRGPVTSRGRRKKSHLQQSSNKDPEQWVYEHDLHQPHRKHSRDTSFDEDTATSGEVFRIPARSHRKRNVSLNSSTKDSELVYKRDLHQPNENPLIKLPRETSADTKCADCGGTQSRKHQKAIACDTSTSTDTEPLQTRPLHARPSRRSKRKSLPQAMLSSISSCFVCRSTVVDDDCFDNVKDKETGGNSKKGVLSRMASFFGRMFKPN